MRGTKTDACYRLGERVRVQVRFADRFTRSIDFILAEDEMEGKIEKCAR